MADKQNIIIGYWGFRGSAQPIRHLLVYLNVPFINRVYSDPKKWFEDEKLNFGAEFPNLPYLQDGEFKLTESSAIPVYLTKKYNRPDLFGDKDYKLSGQIQQILGVLQDYYKGVVIPLIFDPNFEKRKADAWDKAISRQTNRLTNVLSNKQWICGQISYADFMFYEYLCYIRGNQIILKGIYPEMFVQYQNFVEYMKRFEEIPQIKIYMASQGYIKAPFMPPERALWTGLQ